MYFHLKEVMVTPNNVSEKEAFYAKRKDPKSHQPLSSSKPDVFQLAVVTSDIPFCVYTHVCEDVCVCMCMHMQRLEDDVGCRSSNTISLGFLRQGLSLAWNLSSSLF